MTEASPPTAQSALDRTATQSNAPTARPRSRFNPRAAIAGVLSLAIIGLAIWYLARPEPLLVQGEVESTRIDMAARVSGRLAKIAVVRGQDATAGTTLLVIDNPELVAQLHEAEAEKLVADAELARINVGTRSEVVAQRKAEIDRATASVTLAQQTYNRTKQLEEAVKGFTAEEHQIAEANVGKAAAKIETIRALVDQMTVTAPVASQVYQIPAEQ